LVITLALIRVTRQDLAGEQVSPTAVLEAEMETSQA
jgi:hypothetical protein